MRRDGGTTFVRAFVARLPLIGNLVLARVAHVVTKINRSSTARCEWQIKEVTHVCRLWSCVRFVFTEL